MSHDFVHLHVHSQYSLLHGAISIDRLVERVKTLGMKAVALTDHANLFGAVEFYEKAKKEGIHPIFGCEVYYLGEGSRLEKSQKFREHHLFHLLLLVENEIGYRNLCHLLTSSYLEGFYYKPRLDKQVLSQFSEGLIALSCCMRGEIPRKIIEGKIDEASRAAAELANLFPGRFYLELTDHGLATERLVNETLIDLSKKLSLPLVATQNAHYLLQEDREAHEALLCIQTNTKLHEEDRLSYDGSEFYLKSPDQMSELFSDFPEALENTVKIAERCQFQFELGRYHFPYFDAGPGKTPEELLRERVYAGLDARWDEINRVVLERFQNESGATFSRKDFYIERLEFELKTILAMGFASYFLIVSDFIHFAKSKGIPVGPGRGSAAGSLVAYCLRITDLDPIPYNLLFERFLNPERISMPDMDIDFCMNRRDEVIAYVNEKYQHVAQIITFGKMKAKAVIRDVGRVLDMPYAEVDKIAKLVPNELNITLEEALKAEPKLQELEKNDRKVRQLLGIARSLEGLTRHASTHAAGVVIADRPLNEFLPLYRGTHDETVAQFDMKAVEKIGLVKFDFLGLKTLTVIETALKIIRKTRGITIDLLQIPIDDPKVYEMLSRGDVTGVFQLEKSSGMRELLVKLKPSSFEDIIALVALYRPGPLGSGMVDDFIDRKHARTSIVYDLEQLEPILKDTYGVIVYQEQVMQIASALAGFSLGDADLLRRAMGKKKPEEMAKQRERFISGAIEKKIPPKKAEKIFDLMAKFAEYGFNKSHSAAYALISYQTAYLKAYFQAEYMASLLTHEMGDHDKILIYIQDLMHHQISVLPPDLHESEHYFSVLSQDKIRFGLAAIKNIGEAAIESLVETRKRVGRFESLFHFCEEVDSRKINRKVIESLIKAGAMDGLGMHRAEALAALDVAISFAALRQKDREQGQGNLFDFCETISTRPAIPEVSEWSIDQKLKAEKEMLGFYVTAHPLEAWMPLVQKVTEQDTASLQNLKSKTPVILGGMIVSLKEIQTKRGNRMGFMQLEDLKGSIEVVVFSDLYQDVQSLLKIDEPILVWGTFESEEDNFKILAERIEPLKNGRLQKALPLKIEIALDQVDEKRLDEFRRLLCQYPGDAPVFLHLGHAEGAETILRLPRTLEVEHSEALLKELKNFWGQSARFSSLFTTFRYAGPNTVSRSGE